MWMKNKKTRKINKITGARLYDWRTYRLKIKHEASPRTLHWRFFLLFFLFLSFLPPGFCIAVRTSRIHANIRPWIGKWLSVSHLQSRLLTKLTRCPNCRLRTKMEVCCAFPLDIEACLQLACRSKAGAKINNPLELHFLISLWTKFYRLALATTECQHQFGSPFYPLPMSPSISRRQP